MNREKMTIDEAMAIIRKEYLCVDRDCDIEQNCGKCDLMMPSKEPILEAYKMAIKALEQEQKWIPVSEGLPEEGQWVMVTFDGKIAVCIAHDNDGTLREATSLVLKNATEIWLYPESEWGDGYAAWMPLPKPYEPQESEGKE